MIAVTGGAGFIGRRVIRALNARGRTDVLLVERGPAPPAAPALDGLQVEGALDHAAFRDGLARGDRRLAGLSAVIHLGADTDTLARDEAAVLANNVDYALALLRPCLARRVPFVYASSAAVYGARRPNREDPACEAPLNLYARSKWLLDTAVRALLPAARSPVVGLRYFNVYGPGEAHKGRMASLVYQLDRQARAGGPLRLFGPSHGFAAGEQRRDFVHVDDVVTATLWFLDAPGPSGIFNVGTGRGRRFNELARLVLAGHGHGRIEYVPFPPTWTAHYQPDTEADLTALRQAGYAGAFRPIEHGVPAYLAALAAADHAAPPGPR